MYFNLFPFSIFVCLFVFFSSHSRIYFSLIWRNGEGLQILTYTQYSWPLSSIGSLTCHTYCDTGQPFIMVILEDTLHMHLMMTFGSGAVTTCFNDLDLCRSPTCETMPLRWCLSQCIGIENSKYLSKNQMSLKQNVHT